MKRFFDILLSLCAIIVLLPLLLFIVFLVRCFHGSPVIFSQVRPGQHAKPFTIFKFRTMTEQKDNDGNLLPDIQRMTALGRFLRSSSLDELPELINVIKGEMSLVGPRPLLLEYLPLYTYEQNRRHDVKPGITGWAQINGRNAIIWDEKLNLDVWYVDHQSLFLDFKILFLTMSKVIFRKQVNYNENETMPLFRGSKGGHVIS
ncbi:MAG: sugar transferase [Paludibacter sp.]